MISLVCQKSNWGKISAQNTDLVKLLSDDAELNSNQLKKHSKTESLSSYTQYLDQPVKNAELNESKTGGKTDEFSSSLDPQFLTKDFYSKHPLKKLNFKKVKCMNNLIQQKINESPSDLEYYVI